MQKNVKGSALVFSLIVMFIILSAALGVASVSVIDQKNASVTGKSTQAFQVADSAVETVLKRAVTDPQAATLGNLGTCIGATGVVTVFISGNLADVSFKDASGNEIKDGVASYTDVCNTVNLSQVAEVKAVATYGSTTRAISTAVAAGTLVWTPAPLISPFFINGSGWTVPGYTKDSRTGIVYLRGLARRSPAVVAGVWVQVFQLPEGYRPLSGQLTFPTHNHNTAQNTNRIDITASGFVQVYVAGTTASEWVQFDGIFFSTTP